MEVYKHLREIAILSLSPSHIHIFITSLYRVDRITLLLFKTFFLSTLGKKIRWVWCIALQYLGLMKTVIKSIIHQLFIIFNLELTNFINSIPGKDFFKKVKRVWLKWVLFLKDSARDNLFSGIIDRARHIKLISMLH